MTEPKAQRIDKLYAWISRNPDGEGILGGFFHGRPLAMVGADRERMESLREFAELMRQTTGFPMRLKLFSNGVALSRHRTPDAGWKSGAERSIDELYAWIVQPDPADPGEGVLPTNSGVPLISADRGKMLEFSEYAKQFARETGWTVTLKVFTGGVVIEELS